MHSLTFTNTYSYTCTHICSHTYTPIHILSHIHTLTKTFSHTHDWSSPFSIPFQSETMIKISTTPFCSHRACDVPGNQSLLWTCQDPTLKERMASKQSPRGLLECSSVELTSLGHLPVTQVQFSKDPVFPATKARSRPLLPLNYVGPEVRQGEKPFFNPSDQFYCGAGGPAWSPHPCKVTLYYQALSPAKQPLSKAHLTSRRNEMNVLIIQSASDSSTGAWTQSP